MHRPYYEKVKCFAFTFSLAVAMSGITLTHTAAAQNRNSLPEQPNASFNGSNSNSMMTQVQQELKQKGFYTGRIDGIDGPRTRMAIRRYQRSQNLDQTGDLNQATLSSLGLASQNQNFGQASRSAEEPNTAPTENSANAPSDEVRAAQRKLTDDGFYNGKIDGVMNEGTRVAIRQYQQHNNLPVTGQLTPETAQSMGIDQKTGNNNQSPLEQLGKGIAEGAKTPQNTNHNGNHQQR